MSTAIINVVSAKPADTYWLQIAFDDATVKARDFGSFLKQSHHPDACAYLQQ